MTALELTIYPRVLGAKFVMWGPGKRFTDAELAAEYWAATIGNLWHADRNNGAQLILGRARSQILRRFATLPHYDEESK